jgi:hypothetical protein
MATFAFVDATTWIGGYDMTTDLNQVALNISADELDVTTFGSGGYRSRIAGLRTVEANFNGFWQAGTGTVDPTVFTDLAVVDRVVTMAPAATETSAAYMWQGGSFTYSPFGQIGEATPFTLGYKGTNGVGCVRGQVAKAKGNVSATGATGSGLLLGAVSSTQFLYSTLHVFSAGTTITIQVQSDDNAGFSSPTTRATIGPITTAGGTWATRVAGPFTDTYWRWNVSAITGTFSIAGAIGIG